LRLRKLPFLPILFGRKAGVSSELPSETWQRNCTPRYPDALG
jgi:hypothetical protein